jgi:hypothetical protein
VRTNHDELSVFVAPFQNLLYLFYEQITNNKTAPHLQVRKTAICLGGGSGKIISAGFEVTR